MVETRRGRRWWRERREGRGGGNGVRRAGGSRSRAASPGVTWKADIPPPHSATAAHAPAELGREGSGDLLRDLSGQGGRGTSREAAPTRPLAGAGHAPRSSSLKNLTRKFLGGSKAAVGADGDSSDRAQVGEQDFLYPL